ncbi:polysaccharide biosynthesis C-terminal domain-containing protein [Devosia sp. ZB163]|uniref:lipopolysaccharide biosynthesis protein n=1 Tax=Devosia sp. ZB163 TaxID=3025938 RepID=UPI002361FA63|nr:polysaccharide biosynthesis C-terminal domain-containing protein [Devosia sp. ZB163]MDC9824140.1 polysaccharide biosynthesis C-terminal domain-containing protein [Devosia sp. ZB163]
MSLRQRLLSQSTVIFGARVFGAGVIFLAQAAIARFWGAEILGEYLLIIATVNIVAVFLPLGFHTVGTYFAAEYRSRGQGGLLRGFMRRTYSHLLVGALVLLVVGYPIAESFGEPGKVLTAHWIPACLMALATGAVYCNTALLVGLRRPFAGYFADTVFRPMLVALCFGISGLALGVAAKLDEMIWLLAIGFVLIAAGQFAWLLRAVRDVPASAAAAPADRKRWWRFAMPWVVISLATDFYFDIDLLVLSNLLDRESLAVFGVCTRVFSLVAFGVSAVYAVTLPEMFERSAASDREGFMRQIGEANLVASGISVGLFAVVAAIAPLLLMLFGPEFEVGVAPLAVLCLTLCVRSVFGPAAMVLSIHDRPYATLPAVVLGMTVLVTANILLVPAHGLMGAAIAALIAQTIWSAAMWVTARRFAGIDVSIGPRLRELLARRVPKDV